jgi:hypothetical protein
MAAYQGGQRSGRGKRKAPARPTASKPSDKRTNFPGGSSKPKPKPSISRPNLYETAYDTRAPRSAYGLTAAPTAPKPKPPTRTTPSRPAARPSTPARPTTSSRRPAPKPPAASSAPKAPKVAQTSGIGPVKSGAAYASKKGSISESVRQLREMRAASVRRQTGQAAPALSNSKDYSSQFKDMKGGSSRFVAELKKKKKGYKLF